MSDDRQNVFERRAARSTLSEDRKNRFTRHQEVVAARRNTQALPDRIARNEAQRSSWAGDGRAGNVRTSGGVTTTLDPETARLKQLSDASRQKAQPVPYAPTPQDLTAFTLRFLETHPEFYESVWNSEAMKNFLLEHIANGTLVWGVEAYERAYGELKKGGYLEEAPRPRTRGEFVSRPAPRAYPPFVPRAEMAAEHEREVAEAAQRVATEQDFARSLDFATLQKQVRGSLKDYGREAVR
jgi:hypothetical protein